jgi:exocyst complex component 3
MNEKYRVAEVDTTDNTYGSLEKQALASRNIRSYRIKYFDVLRESVANQLTQLYETNAADMPTLLSNCDSIIDDLILIHDELEPKFPKKYNIFQFFVLEYHRSIYDMVNKIVEGPLYISI